MNLENELTAVASEELEEEIKAELAKEAEEVSMASLLTDGKLSSSE